MKFIILVFSIFFAFSSCQKDTVYADQNIKKPRTNEQSLMVESLFYDIGKMAESIWMNCQIFGNENTETFYVDYENKVLVMRKTGIKNITIGVTKSNNVLNLLGYPDELENESKFIYKKNDKDNEYLISLYFSKSGILTNIVYNVCGIIE